LIFCHIKLFLLSKTYVDTEMINKEHINDIMEICNSSQKQKLQILVSEKSFFIPKKEKKL